MWTKTSTPAEVSDMLKAGHITTYEAQDYCDLWNTGPHFTVAVVTFGCRVSLLQWDQLTPDQVAHVDAVKATGAAAIKARYGDLV